MLCLFRTSSKLFLFSKFKPSKSSGIQFHEFSQPTLLFFRMKSLFFISSEWLALIQKSYFWFWRRQAGFLVAEFRPFNSECYFPLERKDLGKPNADLILICKLNLIPIFLNIEKLKKYCQCEYLNKCHLFGTDWIKI